VNKSERKAARLLTTDDVDVMGDAARGYELVDGVLVEKPPSHLASYCSVQCIIKIHRYLEDDPFGYVFGSESMYRMGVRRAARNGRKPDVSVLLLDQLPDGHIPDTTFHGRPTLAFESVSPGDSADALEQKLLEYVQAGVPLIWVVYPQTRLGRIVTDGHSRFLNEEETFDGGDVLPGFQVKVAALLPPPDRVRNLTEQEQAD
jgi:Uma2 family endonuclease